MRTAAADENHRYLQMRIIVSGPDPGRWVDRMIGWCWGILGGAIALYCAIALIEAMLPTLMAIIGVLAIIGLIVGGIVVFRTWCNRW